MNANYLFNALIKKSQFTICCVDKLNKQTFTGQGQLSIHHRINKNAHHGEIDWQENGQWQQPNQLTFNNHYRWFFNTKTNTVTVSHARYGIDNTVELVNLIYCEIEKQWISAAAHLCIDDLYHLTLSIDAQTIHLHWQITGPKKSQIIDIVYQ